MSQLEKAIIFATKAHAGQVDMSGEPHILHSLRVMLGVQAAGGDHQQMIAAVLHDVVEDTKVTLNEVYEEFGFDVGEMVDRLTHRQDEKYIDYIDRVYRRHRATFVKLRDLEDNMDPRRITEKHGLYSRYAKAYYKLRSSRYGGV